MQMNEILRLLKGVKRNGGQYQAHCPAHDDREPSLSISESDGKILLYCHAGCTKESIVAALGLKMKDLFISEGIDNAIIPKREITAVYDYIDMDGKIVHSTIRYNPKSFSQRRPDPNRPGEYIYKDVFKGITPILYNLQAVTQAIKEKQPVLVVEGEKDCDNLKKYGIVATTCPMGAGKWHNRFSAALNGGNIYIVADNDDVGYSHSKNIAKSLVGKAESIYLIDLTAAIPDTMDELPKGWDISDFLESTPQESRQLAIKGLMTTATPYIVEVAPSQEKTGKSPSEGKKSQAEMLLNLVEDTTAGFFHNTIKELYATIPVENHVEVLPLVSRDFEIWLTSLFYKGYARKPKGSALYH